jgi:HPt (histidine-containing phosphotransfer) domain-containing protein
MRNKIAEDSDLTSEIRDPQSEIKSIPIIAMTAHAMSGDEDKSIQAGMNGHVTKPIDPDQLFTTLQKWIQPGEKRVHAQEAEVFGQQPDADQLAPDQEELPEILPGFNLTEGLKRLRGNRHLYRKLLLDFGANYTETAGEIRTALDVKDLKHAHSLVHNIKGLAGNLAATDLQAAAVEMEKLVKGESEKIASIQEMNRTFAKLEDTMNKALEAVQSLGVSVEDTAIKVSDEEIAAIPADLAKDIADRIREAAELGDIRALTAVAEEIKDRSDSCIPLSKRIAQLAEDFDFDGILKLAEELDS